MNTKLQNLALAAALLGLPAVALAADHIDSPAAEGESTADITDLYAWMSSDAQHLNLVLDVHHNAGPNASFSDATQYVFHVNSSVGYGEAQSETAVLCQFYDETHIECWAGDEYLTGDPSDPEGIVSASGKLRVFAGLRNDPFFMELAGFKETVGIVVGAAPSLTFDEHGCPAVDAATSGALVGQLQSGPGGVAASDTFAGSNVLALVVQVDKSVVTSGGPLLSSWGTT
jgi:hypothetical protein